MPYQKKTIAPLCKRDHACRGTHTYCRPALPLDGDKFYFVGQADKNSDCPYIKKYGDLHTCDCPVRQEIYQRYRI